MAASESSSESLTVEPAALWEFDRLLDELCAQLGSCSVALATVRVSQTGLCGVWLGRSRGFPEMSPPGAEEILSRVERVVVLDERRDTSQDEAVGSAMWIAPLSTSRGTCALIAEPPLSEEQRQRLQSATAAVVVTTAVSEYERLYLASVLLAAVDSAPDPIEITDADARLFYVNEAWRRYFEYRDVPLLGATVGSLVRDDENPVHDEAYVEFTFAELSKRREWLGVLGSRSRDGQRRFNEARVSPFDDASRQYHGNLAVRRDLSHRKSRDEALASAHREFRAVLAAMPDAVVVLRDNAIYFANDAFATLVGHDRTSVIGAPFDSFVHPDDRQAFASHRDAGWAKNVRLLHQSGALRIAEVSAAGDVSFEGSPSLILLARDVTERVLEREQMARSDRLAALGALAAGVAHEINNPLAYVLLNLETAQASSHPGIREALDEAMDGARRIGAIVAELRGFWNGSGDALGAVDVTTAITSAVNLVQNEIRHRAELVRQLEPGLTAFARHGQVVQVLVNLLVNAAQAIPSDRESKGRPRVVTVRSRAVSLTELEITVSDTGFGISPEVRESLFEPGAPVSASGLSPGFGLAISKRIAQELKGTISVSETGPGGTTLAVRLPRLHPEEELPDSRKSHVELLQSPYRVLVVDDEPMLARAVKRALDAFVVEVVTDGEEALALLESAPAFDVILCDLMMPRVSGAELFRRVSSQNPHMAQRFVFMTGGAFSDWSQRFLDTVERPIIEKPFQPSQLRKCIEDVARQTRRA